MIDLEQAVSQAGSIRKASVALGIPATTIRRQLKKNRQFDVDSIRSATPDITELLNERLRKFDFKQRNFSEAHIRTVRMKDMSPIGIGFMGDPHIDDDGTDIRQLLEHTALFDGRHQGLYAILLGDLWNNWQGRLARLWADQSTSALDARRLVEYFLKQVQWLAVVFGNHDCLSNKQDILEYILSTHTSIANSFEQRIRIIFPNDRQLLIHARHQFPGSSQWVKQFGQIKAAKLDGRSHIYVGADRHVSGYSNGVHPGTGTLFHALQVASYKRLDDYPIEMGFMQEHSYVCPVAIVDPTSKNDVNFLRWEFDPFEGAARLAWLRSRP